jgi:catechol 2,3-dioxygenase-like lactoylglutathione lyase family enzyme
VSFLVDPPLLFASGAAIEAAAPDEDTARRLETAVLGVFVVTSVSLYANARWTHWLARLCRADSGRDWMLNSGVFHFDHDRAGIATHLVSAALFSTYPLWIRLGRRAGGRLRPRAVATVSD